MSISACLRAVGLACAVALLSVGCGAPSSPRELTVLQQAPLHTFNEHEVNAYLKWLHSHEPDLSQRVTHLARRNLGQAYRLFLLGEFPYELHDPDPLYCLSAGDCVTFVEQTYAMALSYDWPSFFRTLQRIRYRDGHIGIRTRNHFTEADWNANNRWLFEDMTESLAAGSAVTYQLRIDRRSFFQRFGVEWNHPNEEFTDSYIPRNTLEYVSAALRDADVIEFVRGSKDAPYVGHMGLIARNADDRVMLIHSTRPRVREEWLQDYFARRPEMLGFKVLRPREQPQWSWTVEHREANR